jgi:hypothetical protein
VTGNGDLVKQVAEAVDEARAKAELLECDFHPEETSRILIEVGLASTSTVLGKLKIPPGSIVIDVNVREPCCDHLRNLARVAVPGLVKWVESPT